MAATPDRDAANEVYTPLHQTRLVSSFPDPAVPTLDTDGTDCSKWNVLTVFRKNIGATTSAYELYFFDNTAWHLAEDSSTLAVADYDPTATSFIQPYNIIGVYKFEFRMVSADGSVRVTENLQV